MSSSSQEVAVGSTLMKSVLLIQRDSLRTFLFVMAAMHLTSGTSTLAWRCIAPNAIIVCIQLKKFDGVMISKVLRLDVTWMAVMLISQRFFSLNFANVARSSSNNCRNQRHCLRIFKFVSNMNPGVVTRPSRSCLTGVIQPFNESLQIIVSVLLKSLIKPLKIICSDMSSAFE